MPKMSKLCDHIGGMDYVRTCYVCGGEGEYDQLYTVGCGGGTYTSKGRCDYCGGCGIVMHDNAHVPASVVEQIRVRALPEGVGDE